ncbi:MAG: cob(I)yrinic acid a,c-diamide adenosyltransferase [Chitinophagales bacterium]
MKIYTKTGDLGETSLYGGKRMSKANIKIDAYGTVDELNAHIGLVKDVCGEIQHDILLKIQENLFVIGAFLATPADKENKFFENVNEKDIEVLEKQIDLMNESLKPLTKFILPGGHQYVSYCHITRTVCRRAERIVVDLSSVENVNLLIVKYLNRLSDYIFVLSRFLASKLNVSEIEWLPKKNK